MIRKIISVALLLTTIGAYAQVGIGTKAPHSSALLDLHLENENLNDKGLLIPRVELRDIFNSQSFGANGAAKSLLVYNNRDYNTIIEGFYYWDGQKWCAFLTDSNLNDITANTVNESFTIAIDPITTKESLTITDSEGHSVYLPLEDIANNNEFITNLTTNQEFLDSIYHDEVITTLLPITINGVETGSYIYTNEENKDFYLHIAQDVINNFDTIVESAGKKLESTEGTISIKGKKGIERENKAVLQDIDIDVMNNSITALKLNSGVAIEGMVATANGDGTVKYDLISTEMLDHLGSVSTDGIITVSPGHHRVLGDIDFSIADESITDSKLHNLSVTPNKLYAGRGLEKRIPIADTEGNVTYEHISISDFGDGDNLTADKTIDVLGGEGSTLSKVELAVAKHSITAEHLDPGDVEEGSVGVVDKEGNVIYQTINTTMISGKGELKGDAVIDVIGGKESTFDDVSLTLNKGSLTPDYLNSGNADSNTVATSDGKGNVTYQKITTDNLSGKGNITTDNIILVDNGTGKVLSDVTLSLSDNSISTIKLQEKAVTVEKLNSGDADKGLVLLTDGKEGYILAGLDAFTPTATDLTADKTIEVLGGEGSTLSKVELAVAKHSITGEHLDPGDVEEGSIGVVDKEGNVIYQTINTTMISGKGELKGDAVIDVVGGKESTFDDVSLALNKGSLTPDYLNSGNADDNTVATSDGKGNVTYQKITTDNLSGKGNITTDNIILVDNGMGKVLSDVTLSLSDNSISTVKLQEKAVTVEKLNSGDADKGLVLLTDGKEGYTLAGLDAFTPTATDLIADKTIDVLGGEGSTLSKVELAVAKHSITGEHLDPGNVEEGSVGVVDKEGNVIYQTINTTMISGKGELKGDAVIDVIGGKESTFDDVSLALNKGSLTPDYLNSGNADDNTVATSDGKGNVTYQKITTDNLSGKGLTTTSNDSPLSIVNGDNSVLNSTTIDVKNEGILNQHLAPISVTTDKISSQGGKEGYVLVASGNSTKFVASSTLSNSGSKTFETDSSMILNGGAITQITGAVMKDIKVGVAIAGIENKHIKDREITAGKLSSAGSTGFGQILYSMGSDVAAWHNQDEYAKGFTSVGRTISISGNKVHKALLNEVNLDIAPRSITANEIADKGITIDKISSVGSTGRSFGDDYVLVADGNGGVAFQSLNVTSARMAQAQEEHASDYSYQPQVTGEQWLDTSKKVLKQVININLVSVSDSVVLDNGNIDLVLEAILINKKDNSVSKNIIKKENVNNKTVLYMRNANTNSDKLDAGQYYLILKYVSR